MYEEEFEILNQPEDEYLLERTRIGWVPPTSQKSVEVYVMTDDGGKNSSMEDILMYYRKVMVKRLMIC